MNIPFAIMELVECNGYARHSVKVSAKPALDKVSAVRQE